MYLIESINDPSSPKRPEKQGVAARGLCLHLRERRTEKFAGFLKHFVGDEVLANGPLRLRKDLEDSGSDPCLLFVVKACNICGYGVCQSQSPNCCRGRGFAAETHALPRERSNVSQGIIIINGDCLTTKVSADHDGRLAPAK